MKPTKAVLDLIATAIAAVAILGGGTGVAKKAILFKNDFDPDEDTVFGDLTAPDFSGYSQIALSEEVASTGVDALSLQRKVVSGTVSSVLWTTADASNLPQTIYGYGIVNAAGTGLLAAARFAEPIELLAAGQIISVPELAVSFDGSDFE